jgi:hypothetical protein
MTGTVRFIATKRNDYRENQRVGRHQLANLEVIELLIILCPETQLVKFVLSPRPPNQDG